MINKLRKEWWKNIPSLKSNTYNILYSVLLSLWLALGWCWWWNNKLNNNITNTDNLDKNNWISGNLNRIWVNLMIDLIPDYITSDSDISNDIELTIQYKKEIIKKIDELIYFMESEDFSVFYSDYYDLINSLRFVKEKVGNSANGKDIEKIHKLLNNVKIWILDNSYRIKYEKYFYCMTPENKNKLTNIDLVIDLSYFFNNSVAPEISKIDLPLKIIEKNFPNLTYYNFKKDNLDNDIFIYIEKNSDWEIKNVFYFKIKYLIKEK